MRHAPARPRAALLRASTPAITLAGARPRALILALGLALAVTLGATRASDPAAGSPPERPSAAWPPDSCTPRLQLVESFPIETHLDHGWIRDADSVWVEMIAGARESIDLAEFYASDQSDSRLQGVIAALEAAAARGVRVRFLAEKKFHAVYPQTLDRLATQPGVEVRLYDVAALMGGVLHAKYFIVDGRDAFLGSQNFDWRALTHIQELGIRIRVPAFIAALRDLFEMDWALAGGAVAAQLAVPAQRSRFPVRLPSAPRGSAPGESLLVTPAFSPRGWLPDSSLWDLPQITALIDSARQTVRVQLLTYRTTGRDGAYFADLENALRRAAARGVAVQMLLADWSQREGIIAGLQSLEALPGIDIRLVTIPPWSGGFIPFARVIHAKYLVVDGTRAWIGTSNWEADYFHASRNVGLILVGAGIPAALDRFFLDGWSSSYARAVDPCRRYAPPRIAE